MAYDVTKTACVVRTSDMKLLAVHNMVQTYDLTPRGQMARIAAYVANLAEGGYPCMGLVLKGRVPCPEVQMCQLAWIPDSSVATLRTSSVPSGELERIACFVGCRCPHNSVWSATGGVPLFILMRIACKQLCIVQNLYWKFVQHWCWAHFLCQMMKHVLGIPQYVSVQHPSRFSKVVKTSL